MAFVTVTQALTASRADHEDQVCQPAVEYVFGNRVAESGLDRAYQGKREPDHRTSE
jgi:hypothetical protein